MAIFPLAPDQIIMLSNGLRGYDQSVNGTQETMTSSHLRHKSVTDKDVFDFQVTVYNWWMT